VSSEALTLLHELVTATRSALVCARALDGAGLDQANRERGDLLFSLRIALTEGVHPAELDAMRAAAHELDDLEDRLERVAIQVVGVIEGLRQGANAATYSASGRVAAG